MTPTQLDWSEAAVSDGKLTVGFTGTTPKEWREAFLRAATLLSHGKWELSEVKGRHVQVSPVQAGDEERIKHFLESAVLEANATFVDEDELFGREAGEQAVPENEAHGPEASPDEELTARFRGFAGDAQPDD